MMLHVHRIGSEYQDHDHFRDLKKCQNFGICMHNVVGVELRGVGEGECSLVRYCR